MNGPAKIFMLAVWMLFAALGSLQAMDLEPIPAKELQLNSDGSISGTYQTLTEGDISIVHYLPSGAPSDGSFLVGDGSTYVKESGATARTSMGAAASGAIGSSGLTTGTDTILGRDTAGTGAIEQLTLGSGLALTSGVISVTGGSGGVGDVTGASSSTAQKAVVFSDTSGKALDEAAGAGNTFDPSTGAFTTTEGTAANPAIRMYGEAAGLYPYGSDGIGLSADGAPALEMSASGIAARVDALFEGEVAIGPKGSTIGAPSSVVAGTATEPGGYDLGGTGSESGDFEFYVYAYRTVDAVKYYSYSDGESGTYSINTTLAASTFDIPISWIGPSQTVDGYLIVRRVLDEFPNLSSGYYWQDFGSGTSVVDDGSGWTSGEPTLLAAAKAVLAFDGYTTGPTTLAGAAPTYRFRGAGGDVAILDDIPDIAPADAADYLDAKFRTVQLGKSTEGLGLSILTDSDRGDIGAISVTNYDGTTDARIPFIGIFKNDAGTFARLARITFAQGDADDETQWGYINFHASNRVDISGTLTLVEGIYARLGNGEVSIKSDVTNPDHAPAGTNQSRLYIETSTLTSDAWIAPPDIGGAKGSPKMVGVWTSNPATDAKIVIADGTGTAAGIEASTASISNTAYDATTWNGNADVATKDAIRDKIESVVSSIPNLASPGAIGGTTPAAGTFTSLLASDPVAVTETRWIDFSAAAYAGAVETSVVVADASTGELQANGLAASVFFPIPTMPGSVLTRVRIKNAGITSGDGVTLTLLKRDESSTSTAFTTIGSPQTYNDEEVTVNVYDVPDETMVANTSYTAKVTLSGTIVSASIWSIGYEFSTMTY